MEGLKLELADGKPPFMPLIVKDVVADENATLMDNREFGCYMKLLMHQWIERSIPADIGKIARICREDANAMRSLWDGIAPCFIPIPDEPGRLRNEKLNGLYDQVLQSMTKRKKAGETAANARWGKDSGQQQPGMQSECDRTANAPESQYKTMSMSDTYSEEEYKEAKKRLKELADELRADWVKAYEHIFAVLPPTTYIAKFEALQKAGITDRLIVAVIEKAIKTKRRHILGWADTVLTDLVPHGVTTPEEWTAFEAEQQAEDNRQRTEFAAAKHSPQTGRQAGQRKSNVFLHREKKGEENYDHVFKKFDD